jgi:positive regulator of sigma E activity
MTRRAAQGGAIQFVHAALTRCRSTCRSAAACASAIRREAGNRVERAFRGEFRQRVLVAEVIPAVLSRAMDTASNRLLLAA